MPQLAATLLLLFLSQLPPQPDFSGRWVLERRGVAALKAPPVLVVEEEAAQPDANTPTTRWERFSVRGDESKTAIRSGDYCIGGIEGGLDGDGNTLTQRIEWQGEKLVITSERRTLGARRRVLERHVEAWTLLGRGELVIKVTETGGRSEKATFTYLKAGLPQ
jgi:hypothetical protein